MATFLLTWNPKKWTWHDAEQMATRSASGESVITRWSCGINQSIAKGDRFFFMRQGVEPRGVIGSGLVRRGSYEDAHWDLNRSDMAWYVDIRFERLLNPLTDDIVPFTVLQAHKVLGRVNWRTQMSGISIQEPAAETLEQLWEHHLRISADHDQNRYLFVPGKLYNRQQLHAQYGGQHQGGISTPQRQRLIFLFTGESGSAYGYWDGFQSDGTYWYTGEGQVGDMRLTKGNLAISRHQQDEKTLHLFEAVGGGRVRYLGRASYLDHRFESAPDRNAQPRSAIVFKLSVDCDATGELPTSLRGPELGVSSRMWRRPLSELRELAIQRAPASAPTALRLRNVRQRCEAVRVYVLRRADGNCEGCGKNAPFTTPAGHPYLEPHHLRRLSDDGPDHPRWVIALCPNCHKRVHHAADGDRYNERLKGLIDSIEAH